MKRAGSSTRHFLLGAFIVPVLLAPAGSATAQTWTLTGSMAIPRSHHTATLLTGGKVLVAGGSSTVLAASAELYDPATGTWTATGSMSIARLYHKATLLPNGKVLVVGGRDASSNETSVAELYDPVSGTWAGSGSMQTGRSFHSATLLPNGQVLIAGGTIGIPAQFLASAELYDPSTGSFSPTASMNATRSDHTATLLPDGRVLVTGGRGSGPGEVGQLSSGEVYDPTSGTWTLVASMGVRREAHAATLLPSGQVLISGGFGPNEGALNSAELFNPATGAFAFTGGMQGARAHHEAVLQPNGQVLVAGGFGTDRLASAELYDPATGTWALTIPMNFARGEHSAALLSNGQVLVAGGGADANAAVTAELFGGPLRVTIDIKPGSDPNSINLSAAGIIPVAILSSPTFDATQVDPASVALAGARVKLIGKGDRYACSPEDVNLDGLLDLVCHVLTAQSMIEPGDSVAVLEAETFSGQSIRGEDSIQIVPD